MELHNKQQALIADSMKAHGKANGIDPNVNPKKLGKELDKLETIEA